MPKYKYGDMFKKYKVRNSLFVITTNSYVRKDGCLVMGRGAALQLKNEYPEVAEKAGRYIVRFKEEYKHSDYLFFTLKDKGRPFLGFLQVKRHFKDEAHIQLICDSIGHMNQFVETAPWIKEVNMNYPGIGFGGLEKKKVKPALKILGKRFNIWQFKK